VLGLEADIWKNQMDQCSIQLSNPTILMFEATLIRLRNTGWTITKTSVYNNNDQEVIDDYGTIALFVTHPNYKGLGPKNVLLTVDYFGQSKSTGDIS
jgi:hypothetical protein